MAKHAAHENDVDNAVAGLPFAVAGYDDYRNEHEREAIVDGAEAANEA